MSDEHTDWIIVEQVKAGDDRAFDALMARYKRPVINFVCRLIGNASEAEDLAQDVFVRAYQNIRKPGFHQTTGAFSTWLFQVARNAAIDCLRRRKRRPTESLTTLEEDGENLAVTARTADREIAVKEIGEQIAAAVALLPEDQKTAVILSEYENLSYVEIAAIMKCSVKSVESRLYRAKQFLRDRLRDLLE
ncbi:MAG: sigma-70 family RNA polymerase sigma factor [Verrucomicrobia bacterium]|nr:sigma-70 family RNA polymerase sigma factor [Verrucomicrobiota bacterium]MCG2680468.1 sigma-70 family RNA polymerase sigma factor [Kiritimatiellia bacterium]MBU4248401.1 sigma-70 family RNA polymerase sigma factor [Verrucomicrobiota bacterium]MBU4290925.1 sigma-70 family RNA polymerase sigma factor [Verrucomicrobiota bacterium]MBU4428433.1 sigma-70 family RNA polymerase sigma factor [Verrucomicrobiota bacterium]